MTVEGRAIGEVDAWTLLAVAYLGWELAGVGVDDVAQLARSVCAGRRGMRRGSRPRSPG